MTLRFIFAIVLLAAMVSAGYWGVRDQARFNAWHIRLPRFQGQRSMSYIWVTSSAGRFELRFQRTEPVDPNYADYFKDFTTRGEIVAGNFDWQSGDWPMLDGGERWIDFELSRQRIVTQPARFATSRYILRFPLWFALFSTALPAALLIRTIIKKWPRHRGPTQCKSCGYDLRAGHEKCPECGADSHVPASEVAN